MSVSRMFGDLLDHESWSEEAACQGLDIDIFFSSDDGEQKQALELCRACPVQRECLRYAIDQREMYGIWGGMTESERRGIIRDRRRRERETRREAA